MHSICPAGREGIYIISILPSGKNIELRNNISTIYWENGWTRFIGRLCNSLRVRFRLPTSLKTREARVLSADGKGYQVCVILNVVKNLRTKWVLSIGDSGKILRLRCAPLRMTRFFGSPSVSAGAKLPQSDCLKSAIRQPPQNEGAEIPPYGGGSNCRDTPPGVSAKWQYFGILREGSIGRLCNSLRVRFR